MPYEPGSQMVTSCHRMIFEGAEKKRLRREAPSPVSDDQISYAKQHILKTLNFSQKADNDVHDDTIGLSTSEKVQLESKVGNAFKRQQSTSLIIVGTSNSGKDKLIQYATTSYSKGKPVAKVSGHLIETDHEALINIANQLIVRNEKEKDFKTAQEDLEDHFRQCRIDEVPAMIIIDEFQVFAKRNKQILIYTLLDAMHNKDFLFMLIGLTCNSDIHTTLEKRVLSRLNAQFIYMSRPTAEDICKSLHNLLHLPNPSANEENSNNSSIVPNSADSRLSGTLSSNEFIVKFNNTVDRLFDPTSHTPTDMMKIIRDRVEWGLDMEFFHRAVVLATSMLCPSQPLLSIQMLQQAMDMLRPQDTTDILMGLSQLELNLVAAVTRLTFYADRVNQDSVFKLTTVEKICEELDKLTGWLSGPERGTGTGTQKTGRGVGEVRGGKKIETADGLPQCRVFQSIANLAELGVLSLSNGGHGSAHEKKSSGTTVDHVLPVTMVFLSLSLEEVQSAFGANASTNSGSDSSGLGGPSLPPELHATRRRYLLVSERIRRAVLNPFVPVFKHTLSEDYRSVLQDLDL